MLRKALAERQAHQLLFDAISATLSAGDSVEETLRNTGAVGADRPAPQDILNQLGKSLSAGPGSSFDATETVRLAEAVRVLAVRYGDNAVRHCTRLVSNLRDLLDSVTGTGRANRE